MGMGIAIEGRVTLATAVFEIGADFTDQSRAHQNGGVVSGRLHEPPMQQGWEAGENTE